MSSKTELFGENANKVLNTMIKSYSKFLTGLDIEVETKLSNDKVQEALGWLIESHKVDAVRDSTNKIRYVLVDGTYEKNASVVWHALKTNGPQNITELMKTTKLSEGEVHGTLGWLARENDIDFTAKGNVRKYSIK
jgi:hypothetical protein